MPERATSLPLFSSDGKNLDFRAYIFLILLCLAFFSPGFATLPPTDRDESSFAQATKQMIESGNYVDIRFQDHPRYKKPIGIYWLQAASVRLLNGHHLKEIWAYRVPSFIGATTAVVMTALLGALLFGPTVGILAAVMMAGCLILNVEARLAKTDAVLLAAVMVAQYALAKAFIGGKKTGWGNFFVFWSALGAGILIKGPIILLVLFSTLFWLYLSDKNLKRFSSLRPLAGIPYLLLLTAPWFVAIALQSHGTFLEQSAGNDMLAKLWQGQNRGIMPPGLHLLVFPIIFFPFSLFALLAIPDAWQSRRSLAVKFCLGWIVPAWIVFELSLTKLPHYVLPLYPPIAILAAKALCDGYPALTKQRWLPPLAMGLWLMIGAGFATTFALLPYFVDHTISYGQIAAGALLVIAQGYCLFLLFRFREDSVLIMAAGALVFFMTVFASTLPNLQHMWLSSRVARIATSIKPCPGLEIVSASYEEPSLVFLAGTNTKFAISGEAAAKDMMQDHCLIGLIDDKHQKMFLDAFKPSSQEPIAVSSVQGFNLGHGRPAQLTLYLLRSKPNK